MLLKNSHPKYSYNEHYFDVIDTEEKAYYLALLLIQGSYRENCCVEFRVKHRERSLIEAFKKAIESDHKINVYKKQVGIVLRSHEIIKSLSKYGFGAKDYKNIIAPTFDDPILTRGFVRGLIDARGYLLPFNKDRPNFRLTITLKKPLIDWLASELNIKTNPYKLGKHDCYLIYVYSKQSITEVFEYYYANKDLPVIESLNQRFEFIRDYKLARLQINK